MNNVTLIALAAALSLCFVLQYYCFVRDRADIQDLRDTMELLLKKNTDLRLHLKDRNLGDLEQLEIQVIKNKRRIRKHTNILTRLEKNLDRMERTCCGRPTSSPTVDRATPTLSPTSLPTSPPTCQPLSILKVAPPDRAGAETFGSSIVSSTRGGLLQDDVIDDLIFVGAPGQTDLFGDDSQGIVYVYKVSRVSGDVTLTTEIRNDDLESGTFGRVNAISKDANLFATTIGKIISSPTVEDETCIQIFEANDNEDYDNIGSPVCQTGGFGASISSATGIIRQGGSYLYTAGWVVVGAPLSRKIYFLIKPLLGNKIIKIEFTQDDKGFGNSVAIYQVVPNFAKLGADRIDYIAVASGIGADSGGAVHFYYNDDGSWNSPSWKYLTKKTNPSPLFGSDLAITKGTDDFSYFIIVADPGNAAYVYEMNVSPPRTVQFKAKLTSALIGSGERFATSVAIRNGYVVISSEKNFKTGNSYVFAFDGESWNEKGAVDGEAPSIMYLNGGLVTKTSDWKGILSLNYMTIADVCTNG